MSPANLSRIREIVGAENVSTSPEDLRVHAYDATPVIKELPEAVVSPPDADAIQALIVFANEAGFGIVPRGSGTGLSGSAVPSRNSIVLRFPKWNRILEIDEENLSAWVEPGVITADFHAAVEGRGLFYPPDPGSMRICTLGGNVSQNSGGLRGLKYGVTGNYVMGIEGFLPTGEFFRAGTKCVKDVAGYNLAGLLVGSEGTLAVFSRILLRLIPLPKSRRTMLALFHTTADAAATVSSIVASHIVPATLEFLDKVTINCVEDFAKIGLPRDVESLLLMEADGHPTVVAEEAEAMLRIAKENNAISVEVAQSDVDADRLKTARRAAFSALARMRPTTILEDVTVPRSELPGMVEEVRRIADEYQLMIGVFGHAGDGNLHPTILCDERDADEMHRVELATEEIFSAAVQRGGTITGEHGVGLAKKPFFEKLTPPGTIELMRRVKRAIDPNDILNPGKMISSIPRTETLAV